MNSSLKTSRRCAPGPLLLFLILPTLALAGPPLICHAIAIGQAQSLPWTSEGWKLSGTENYDVKKLVPDTLAILNISTPVLVRMETLRRATLYAHQDPQIAKELIAKLLERANTMESAEPPDALAFFDVGYLAESYKQHLGRGPENPATVIDGYAYVKKAIALRGEDPQMEFAAALITLAGPKDAHREHVLRATAGAKKDSLLAENLASRSMGDKT